MIFEKWEVMETDYGETILLGKIAIIILLRGTLIEQETFNMYPCR